MSRHMPDSLTPVEVLEHVVLPALRTSAVALQFIERLDVERRLVEVPAVMRGITQASSRPCVCLRLRVAGEDFEDIVLDSLAASSKAELVERLRSNLNDFAVESRFGWGRNPQSEVRPS